MVEIWAPAAGYEKHFKISTFGRVKALAREWKCGNRNTTRKTEERIMEPRLSLGYLVIDAYINGEKKILKIHRLVAETFLPNPENKCQVNHKDLNRANSNVKNLEWVTPKENVRHARENKTFAKRKTWAKGSQMHTAKLSEDDIHEIRNSPLKNIDIAARYGMDSSTISRIRTGKYWKHV